MSEDVKLLPCPFCGGNHIFIRDRNIQKICIECGAEGPNGKSEKDANSLWNRRAPEPGTSVIRWTRYDGTPETLPRPWTEKEGAQFVILKRKNQDASQDHICTGQPTKSGYEWYSCSREPEIGDLWAHLPEPPEGVK